MRPSVQALQPTVKLLEAFLLQREHHVALSQQRDMEEEGVSRNVVTAWEGSVCGKDFVWILPEPQDPHESGLKVAPLQRRTFAW